MKINKFAESIIMQLILAQNNYDIILNKLWEKKINKQ